MHVRHKDLPSFKRLSSMLQEKICTETNYVICEPNIPCLFSLLGFKRIFLINCLYRIEGGQMEQLPWVTHVEARNRSNRRQVGAK